jgi:predicted Abi (CAAX) family protease
MGFLRKNKPQAEPPPISKKEWEQEVEDFNEQQLANINNQKVVNNPQVVQEQKPTMQNIPMQIQMPKEQARIIAGRVTEQGFYIYELMTNYKLGDVGDLIE